LRDRVFWTGCVIRDRTVSSFEGHRVCGKTGTLRIIQPAARRAGIKKRVGWHTFRHSYSSLLVANGENVKVVQELMRHASSRFTLDVYSQARKGVKRHAQQRVVQMILPENFDDAVPEILLEAARNDAE
jgi:site-specific recombinase XerD